MADLVEVGMVSAIVHRGRDELSCQFSGLVEDELVLEQVDQLQKLLALLLG